MILTSKERSIIINAVNSKKNKSDLLPTAWSLITGAPGSGKTTMVDLMKSMGLSTIADPGREEYQHQISLGTSPGISRKNYAEFQQLVLKRYLSNIKKSNPDLPLVFDYGIAESLAFMKLTKTPWAENIIDAAVNVKFSNVFLLDMVPLENSKNDSIRSETEQERIILKNLILEIYYCLGYHPLHVPLLPTRERLEWIKSHMSVKSQKETTKNLR